MIGLLMTREGAPIAHQVFLGNTADITMFRDAIADLGKQFTVCCVVVVVE
ncbi:hypothetical protein M1O54_07130 [Dehalococcoidia bacterium]|nr:hypothetical protein [Dehalococcoidia bacterium]